MPRFQATLTDADGQIQTTFLQAPDADDAQRILEQRGHAATDLREVPDANPAGHLAPGQPIGPQGDATGGLIPYKNPCALVAYYLGLFSLIWGAVFALIIVGLVMAGQQP